MLPVTQIIQTAPENFTDEHYRLLELDSHLLNSLKCGDIVSFKGENNDNVMLCTETKTYDIRECETSNSLILVSDLKFPKDLKSNENKEILKVNIMGKNYKYMEVIPCQPPIKKIMKLLENSKFNGIENEYKIKDRDLLTFEELLDKAQASEKELSKALVDLNAVNFKGSVRLLDIDYHFRAISYMLQSIEENSWPLDEINREETISSWTEVIPEEILEKMFDFYTVKSKIVDDIQLYQYKETEVCKILASILLHHATKFNLNDFLQAWKDSVPEGMNPTEDMLYDIAVIDRNSIPNAIWEFNEYNLSENLDERLQHLFKVKSKWTSAEITPYIKYVYYVFDRKDKLLININLQVFYNR